MSRALAQRDQDESPFSRILEDFWRTHDGVLAAVFVDSDGETVDYCSSVPPYDARVAAATLHAMIDPLSEPCDRLGAGFARQWVIECAERDLLFRRVSDGYSLAVVARAGALSARLLAGTDAVAIALRREAGLLAPQWDPSSDPYVVETRPAVAWGYAPTRIHHAGSQRDVKDVLGRWTERGAVSLQPLVCFRVRCADEELTLVHDPHLERWFQR